MLRHFFLGKAALYPIKNYNEMGGSTELMASHLFESHMQNTVLSNNKIQLVRAPSVRHFHLRNTIVNINCSSLIKNNVIYMDRINENEKAHEGFIHFHTKDYALVKKRVDEVIEAGLFLGGNGSWNWFHYLIEILPKLMFSDQINEKTLLVSSIIHKFPSMQASLNCMIDSNQWKIIYLDPSKNYLVKNLDFITDINKVEFNKINLLNKTLPTAYFRPDITRKTAQKLAEHQSSSYESSESSKIFLWREGTHRIARNQQEVFAKLEQLGFKKLDPSKLSFEQQITVYRSAKIIIGISGAAWANLIFCQENTNAIIFSPESSSDFTGFSNLSVIFKVNLINITYKTNELNHSESGFEINQEKLFVILKNYFFIN